MTCRPPTAVGRDETDGQIREQSGGCLALECVVQHAGWPDTVTGAGFAARVAAAIEAQVEFDRPERAVVAFASDAEVQALNHRFRELDKPTNVLSFPAPATQPESAAPAQLGDIILGLETITAEAQDQGIEFDAHVAHLIVHGILHLLGYDHQQTAAAEAMEALEIDILADLGIGNPYTEELVGTG